MQHTLQTQERDYINGHPWENTKMASQGVQVLFKIAFGLSRDEAVEGVKTAPEIHQLAIEHGVEMPITEQVYKVLYENETPQQAVEALLHRALRSEDA